jgi:hypothetical protein
MGLPGGEIRPAAFSAYWVAVIICQYAGNR